MNMRHYLKYLIFLIILPVFTPAKSQVFTFNKKYTSGIVIAADSTKDKIPFAHIFNESQRRGFITNEKGEFQIPVNPGDTLIVSALGYYPKVVFLSEANMERENMVRLTPQLYEIGEVSVLAFRNYDDFKRKFLALELPNTPTDRLKNNLTLIARKEAKQADYERQVKEILEQPGIKFFSASVPIYSREERQLQNFAKVLEKEGRQRVIDKKYNRDIIYEITHLSQDEITEFMGFCNFSEEYLLEASEYDILVKIEEKFKEYQLWKESGSFHFNDELNTKVLIS